MESGFVSAALAPLASPDFTFRATSRFSTEGEAGPKVMGPEERQRRARGGLAPARKINPETATRGGTRLCDRHFHFPSKKLSIGREGTRKEDGSQGTDYGSLATGD